MHWLLDLEFHFHFKDVPPPGQHQDRVMVTSKQNVELARVFIRSENGLKRGNCLDEIYSDCRPSKVLIPS